MELINTRVNDYINGMLPIRDRILQEMENFARENRFPIIGPQAGTFLGQLVLVAGAKRIFEMGSGYGYSAYWMARNLPPSGRVICTDTSASNIETGREFFNRAGIDSRVEFHEGDARDIIKKFDGPFDIILNDIDKEQYPDAFELAMPRLRKGGIFITDNVLWSGRIFDKKQSESTRGIIEFNRKLFNSAGVLSSIIPIRDGLGMAVKISD